jgi:3-deoxy-D-arabino-heptulosonate 7-phosphate (DAHP) synthase
VKKVTDINITSKVLLPTPTALCSEIERSEADERFVAESREAIHKIIFGDDPSRSQRPPPRRDARLF